MLDTLFTDQIYGDLEQLERINQLVEFAPVAAHGSRRVETLMLAPSKDPNEIAGRHDLDLPRGLRALLRVIGGRDASGDQLSSYLTFEGAYTRELIELGYRDAMDARAQLIAFMTGDKAPPAAIAPAVVEHST
jgi:NTE family protein